MAVYTKITREELSEHLLQYSIGDLIDFRGITEGIDNTNYLIRTTTGPYVLTIYESRISAADLPVFIGFMEHLSIRGIECPKIIETKNSQKITQFKAKPSSIVSFLNGIGVKEITIGNVEKIGAFVARLHNSSEGFVQEKQNTLSLSGWQNLFAQLDKKKLETIEIGLCALIESELGFLRNNWPRDLPRGFIHADLFPDNIFFDGEEISGLIDFYFSCRDFFAYDLAIAINAWCFEADSFAYIPNFAEAFLREYQMVRPLLAIEAAALPLLLRGAAMRFLLTRLTNWFSEEKQQGQAVQKNPAEYIAKLKHWKSVY